MKVAATPTRRSGGSGFTLIELLLTLGHARVSFAGQGFIGKRSSYYGADDLMQIGYALHRIGQGLLIYLGVFSAECNSMKARNNLRAWFVTRARMPRTPAAECN